MAQFFSFFKRAQVRKEIVENQRQYLRKIAEGPVAIQYPYPAQGHYNLVNISEGGIQFTCPKPLVNPNDFFTCNVHLVEENIQIAVLAKVIWAQTFGNNFRNSYHVGASFLSIHEEACAVIRNFVRSPMPMSS